MASSQVEIASSPFGCVLRDRNQRDLSRESKWRKFLAVDRLNATTISIASDQNRNENENENENSWHPNTTLRLNQNNNNLNTNCRDRAGMSPGHSSPSSAKKPKTERISRELPSLGAASLVQMWESRLSQNRADSSASSSAGDSGPAEDWHSDRSRDSDACESERGAVRVVDIIRRLAAANQDESDRRDQSGSPTSSSDQAEQRIIFSQAKLSPRIRGRQAFTDLLMQMERERHRELDALTDRRAVSRFPQRGRIQSMLRLRSLQRSVAVQDRHRLRIASSLPQIQQASSIPQLRERFNAKEENVVTSQSGDSETPKSPSSEKPSHTENLEKPSVSSMPDGQTQNHEVVLVEQQDKTTGNDHSAYTNEDLPEELCPTTSLACQGTSSEDRKLDAQETNSDDRNLDLQETSSRGNEFDSQVGIDATDATIACDGWDENDDAAEELEDSYSQYAEETGYDWINDVSHPRSYWEDRRKEWYNEMLNSNSKNGEIRQLLERGTVSGFLAGEFRERMDRLMESRLERQTRRGDSQGREEEEEEDNHKTQLMSFTQSCQESRQQQQQQQQESDEDEEQEEDSLMNGQYHEASDYFDQPTSSTQNPLLPLLRSWSFQHNEASDYSDRAASTSPRQDFPSQTYYQNDRQQLSSSAHHPSVEIELICELRSQMEQLYHEMSDLRKSLKSCMDMQMVLMQQSLNKEVHSDSGEAVPKKGKCRVCCENKVDSLLYRCGHMCTCLKCAHELRWSSGKCPICSAPIVDVVRAFLDDP